MEKTLAIPFSRGSAPAEQADSLLTELPEKPSAGALGSIPGSGRPPGIGNGNPFQYSCLENSRDRGA